jgi:vancomycin resistance protein VanJ
MHRLLATHPCERIADRTKTSIAIAAKVYAAIVVCWQVVIYTGIRDIWIVRLINNFGAWLYLPLALFLPCLFYRQIRKRSLRLLLVILLLFAWEYHWCLLPKIDSHSGSISLKIMTWNLSYDNSNIRGIATTIESEHPDVVAVQELVKSTALELSKALESEFPYRVIPSTFEFGIFSKYPLISSQPPALELQQSKFQEVKISIDKQEIELIDVHLPVPKLKTRQLGWLTVPVDFNTNNWDLAYPVLRDRIENTSRPLLVVGDFNTGERDRNYRLLTSVLNNAFQTAGWGFGMTFPIKSPVEIPVIRIDHIFYSDLWQAQSAWTHKGSGSDHQYLVAKLQLN